MFRGSLVALVTPMTESGERRSRRIRAAARLARRARARDGIVVGGTTGESPTLDGRPNSTELLQIAVQRLGGRMPGHRGHGGTSTAQGDRAHARGLRAGRRRRARRHSVLQPSAAGRACTGISALIADAASVPLILYNVPSRTACDLLPETVERLSRHPQIIGIKEATGSIERGAEILERCGDDFLLLSGDDASCRRTDRCRRAGRHLGHGECRAEADARDGRSRAPADDQAGAGNSTSASRVCTRRCSSSRTRSRPSGRSGGSG